MTKDDRVGSGGKQPPSHRKQDWIASQLRRVYDEALQEDIPPEMLALLSKLDEVSDEESE